MTSSVRRFRSPTTLAKIVTAAHVPLAAGCLAVLVQRVTGVDGGDPWALPAASRHIETLASLDVYLALRAVAGVAFLVWLYRAIANVAAFGEPTESPGFSIACFFVPVVQYWEPYAAVVRAWTGSEPDPDARSATGTPAAPRMVLVWWLTTLLSIGVIFFSAELATVDRAEGWRSSHVGGLFTMAITLASVALTLWLVWAITRRQEQRMAAGGGLARASVVR